MAVILMVCNIYVCLNEEFHNSSWNTQTPLAPLFEDGAKSSRDPVERGGPTLPIGRGSSAYDQWLGSVSRSWNLFYTWGISFTCFRNSLSYNGSCRMLMHKSWLWLCLTGLVTPLHPRKWSFTLCCFYRTSKKIMLTFTKNMLTQVQREIGQSHH